eukprot:5201840-Amphidinium_carterae.2
MEYLRKHVFVASDRLVLAFRRCVAHVDASPLLQIEQGRGATVERSTLLDWVPAVKGDTIKCVGGRTCLIPADSDVQLTEEH